MTYRTAQFLVIGLTDFTDDVIDAFWVSDGGLDGKTSLQVRLDCSKKVLRFFRKWKRKPGIVKLVCFKEHQYQTDTEIKSRYAWMTLNSVELTEKARWLPDYMTVRLKNGDFEISDFGAARIKI